MNLETLTGFVAREIRSFVDEAVRPQPVAAQTKPDEGRMVERASEGSAARQFLESPVVQDFMAKAEAKLTHELLSLELDNDKGRRDLAVAIQTQRQLWKYLLTLASDGRAAERELERLRSGRRDFF